MWLRFSFLTMEKTVGLSLLGELFDEVKWAVSVVVFTFFFGKGLPSKLCTLSLVDVSLSLDSPYPSVMYMAIMWCKHS